MENEQAGLGGGDPEQTAPSAQGSLEQPEGEHVPYPEQDMVIAPPPEDVPPPIQPRAGSHASPQKAVTYISNALFGKGPAPPPPLSPSPPPPMPGRSPPQSTPKKLSPHPTTVNELTRTISSTFFGHISPPANSPGMEAADQAARDPTPPSQHAELMAASPPKFSNVPLNVVDQPGKSVPNGVGLGLYDEADNAYAPSDRSGVELVHWVPTLPQLFIYLLATQSFISFFFFIAHCTEKTGHAFLSAGENWFQVLSWIVLIVMTILNFVYMWFVKQRLLRCLVATLFAFLVFCVLFYAPLTTSYGARAFQAALTFFRFFFIFLVGALYAVAYREDIVPARDHLPAAARNFVVRNRLDQA